MPNYWGCRISTDDLDLLKAELEKGILRQGWGFNEDQNLKNVAGGNWVDEGASRNWRMYNEVKQGDYILVPRVPEWHMVTIYQATEDWDTGYEFNRIGDQGAKDFGHCFPVKEIVSFARNNKNVYGNLIRTLHCRCRFWNMNHCQDDIKHLLDCHANGDDLGGDATYEEKATGVAAAVFADLPAFEETCKSIFDKHYSGTDWEYLLIEVFKTLYPSYTVERVGGVSEKVHGADILIRIPGIGPHDEYLIAIQVKDHVETEDVATLEQIAKARANHFAEKIVIDDSASGHAPEFAEQKVIEKYIVLIGIEKEMDPAFAQSASKQGIRVLYASDVQELLVRYACAIRQAGC